MQAIRLCTVILLLFVSNSSVVTAQVNGTTQDVPIQIRLIPDKTNIMLAESLFFSFEVTNMSGEKLCLGVGGDYRNRFGRPESFNVSVRGADGTEVSQPEVVTLGGFVGCDPIEAGETYTVRLFLPHWATIDRTGSYRVNVKRMMSFSSYEPSGSRSPKYSMLADVNTEFAVVPYEENKMGEIINSLGSIMLDSSDPRASDSAMALASIQDDRVISYFAEALRKFGDSEFGRGRSNEYGISSRSIAVLATYDDDRAIKALEAAMKSPSNDTRENVATAFGDSPHKSGINLLLQMQDDSYWFVRLRVAQGLKMVKTKESLNTLHRLLKDENENVRNAAKESLK